jgi:single-strand DNA-binding protein
MNETQITLSGWIGGEVTLREIPDGRAVATFRMACTPTRYRDGEWVKGTPTWHTVKAWNRLGRHVAGSLASGDPVVVHGRLVADVWEREGKPQTSFEVVASAVGHDLSFGTTVLTRPVPAGDPAPASVPVTAPAVAEAAEAAEVEQPVRAA